MRCYRSTPGMRGARGASTNRARALATVCEAVEFSVDQLGESKGIQPVPELLQRRYLLGGSHFGSHEAIQRGARPVITTREPGASPHLTHELHRGLKEIHHQPELVPVELIDRLQGCR